MIVCDRCPCLNIDGDMIGGYECNISKKFIKTKWNRKYGTECRNQHFVLNKDCPLGRIELKDGTVYVPEVADVI